MSNNTIPSNATNVEFETDVLKSVETRITRQAISGEYQTYQPCVGLTGMVKKVAQALVDFTNMRSTSVPLSDSDIESFLLTITHLRCLQLKRKMPKGVSTLDVPVPDFFRPVLARICKYEDQFRALEITPVFDQACAAKDYQEDKTQGMVSDSTIDFDEIMRVARLLKVNGVRCTNGLPAVTSTTDDAIFRIREDSEGNLLVAGPDVSSVDVLVRSMLRVQFLKVVFGEARTRYVSVEDLRTAWESVVETGFIQ